MAFYAVTIFVSALLLFLVQPLMGKVILPWFGGSSAVWSASVLFFQLLLLLGYVYSHLVVQRLPQRRQVAVHLGLLAVSLVLMGAGLAAGRPTPITMAAPKAPGAAPLVQVLATLAVSVGLPYLVLATTSPLIQAWFATHYPSRDPYPLYALSNAGSILALAAYPFVLEPALALPGQAAVWSVGYVGFAVLLVVLARRALVGGAGLDVSTPTAQPEPAEARPRRLRWWQPALWLAFSTIGSVLLLGATNQITQNVTAVPLLWVGPLAIYLLTFVIAFSGKRGYTRWYLLLFFLVTQVFGYVFLRGNIFPILVQLGVYGLLLFAGCMVSHGELARLRPAPRHLTAFYLAQGLGGALGGLQVNLIAPWLFTNTWEFPLGVLACWLFAGIAVALDRASPIAKREWLQLSLVLLFTIAIFSALDIQRRSVRSFRNATLAAERNFYGVLRVQATELGAPSALAYRMVHGTTIHGLQYADGERRDVPTTYFGPTSGVGRALRYVETAHPDRPKRVGVLGLGVGTLAAYGKPGDLMRFYEIDPAVIRYAKGVGGYYSYLDASLAGVEVVQGDARLALARELAAGAPGTYDLLVVDVFSGDAPPVHLLTWEAFQLYLAHLAEDGVLAINVSTTHLDLKPVIAGLARRAGVAGVMVDDPGDGEAAFPSRWILITRGTPPFEDAPDLQTAYDSSLRLWTDDYSNLLQVLR